MPSRPRTEAEKAELRARVLNPSPAHQPKHIRRRKKWHGTNEKKRTGRR